MTNPSDQEERLTELDGAHSPDDAAEWLESLAASNVDLMEGERLALREIAALLRAEPKGQQIGKLADLWETEADTYDDHGRVDPGPYSLVQRALRRCATSVRVILHAASKGGET